MGEDKRCNNTKNASSYCFPGRNGFVYAVKVEKTQRTAFANASYLSWQTCRQRARSFPHYGKLAAGERGVFHNNANGISTGLTLFFYKKEVKQFDYNE